MSRERVGLRVILVCVHFMERVCVRVRARFSWSSNSDPGLFAGEEGGVNV